jgi:hypothetical protein
VCRQTIDFPPTESARFPSNGFVDSLEFLAFIRIPSPRGSPLLNYCNRVKAKIASVRAISVDVPGKAQKGTSSLTE